MPSLETSSSLDWTHLPREFPRTWLPQSFDAGAWDRVLPFFQELGSAPLETVEQVQLWLARRSELLAAIQQEGEIRSIRFTLDTQHPAYREARQEWSEKIVPLIKVEAEKLNRRLAESSGFTSLPDEPYGVMKRSVQNEIALFRKENIPLEVEEDRLGQAYEETVGAMSVPFRGQDYTLPQMRQFSEDLDRSVREEAWRATAEQFYKRRERFEEIFSGLLARRARQAEQAGFQNYRDYQFRRRERFEYGPAECEAFHAAVEQTVAPLVDRLRAVRARRMGLPKLSPWDLHVDPEGRPRLMPFTGQQDLVQKSGAMFQTLDPELAGYFERLKDGGLLDLESRPRKMSGGYQAYLSESRLPFIFMNASGMPDDVNTLVHECGHAFHTFLFRAQPLLDFQSAPLEFCEVASMGMELLTMPYWEAYYPGAPENQRARAEHWRGVLNVLPWVATIDAFQHWVYTHPGHTPEHRASEWMRIWRRFHPNQDIQGLEGIFAYRWHAQNHVFLSPFYYIEYGIAQLGALQLWQQAQGNEREAIKRYKAALALGNTRTLPRLFEAAGLQFRFDAEMVGPLMKEVEAQLTALGEL